MILLYFSYPTLANEVEDMTDETEKEYEIEELLKELEWDINLYDLVCNVQNLEAP